ncbi:hypothetical protein ACX80Z_09395 [Arthrobacter sp. TMT4-20]
MPADQPTILAGTTGRRPRVTYVGSVDAIAVGEPLDARLPGRIQ